MEAMVKAPLRLGGSILVALLVACFITPPALAAKKIPNARLSKGVYTSVGGAYSFRVPAPSGPGSWSEERQLTPETHGVYFGDDFGRGFFILLTDNRRAKLTLDSIAAEYQVGEGLREKSFVTTARGAELRLAGVMKGESPLVARKKIAGKWVDERLDMIQAQSLFLHGQNIYQVTAVMTMLSGHPHTEAEIMDQAKERLTLALEGLEIPKASEP